MDTHLFRSNKRVACLQPGPETFPEISGYILDPDPEKVELGFFDICLSSGRTKPIFNSGSTILPAQTGKVSSMISPAQIGKEARSPIWIGIFDMPAAIGCDFPGINDQGARLSPLERPELLLP